jgi:deazaflavin-dependent oxidoreductase (nitroreductase family)
MPLPNALARLNRVVLNRITRRFATWVPGLGVVVHVGRRSGSRYRTPVNVFSSGLEYTLALTYGAKTDWVRNVLAAGGCELITRRRTVRLTNPRIVHDETRARIRPLERAILRLLNVADFVILEVEDGTSPGARP